MIFEPDSSRYERLMIERFAALAPGEVDIKRRNPISLFRF